VTCDVGYSAIDRLEEAPQFAASLFRRNCSFDGQDIALDLDSQGARIKPTGTAGFEEGVANLRIGSAHGQVSTATNA
jgi:hypothetical protein